MASFLLMAVTSGGFEQICGVTAGGEDHCEQPALSCSCSEGLMGFVSTRDKLGCVAACF